MKKVAFITIHIGFNFGSNLQAIATSKILKKVGCESVCVNYIPPRTTWRRYWKDGFQSFRKVLSHIVYFPFTFWEKRRFSNYLVKNCKVSKPIYNEDDFTQKCPKADVYMTGSDQVWNFFYNEGLDIHYFFDGINGKKIAYASSLGMAELTEEEKNWMEKYTHDYSFISVREKTAVSVFEQIGRKTVHVIDPTMMLNYKEWERYAKPRLVKEPYLFVYLPYNVSDVYICYATARKIAKLYNLKVVSFSIFWKNDKNADKTIRFTDPGDFLSLMIHADYVLTNSFHGTAFSINLHKKFYVFMPSKFSTRITSILEMCGLEKRLLSKEIVDDEITLPIDYSIVENALEREREKALDFLRNALN